MAAAGSTPSVLAPDRAVAPSPFPRPHAAQSFRTIFRIFWENPLSFAGLVIVVGISLAALVVWLAPGVLPYPPEQLNTSPYPFASPSFHHPFGTDELGRDMYSRVLTALPLDLGIGLAVAGLSLLIGGSLGLVAGYWDSPRTWGAVSSGTILRIADIFLSFPTLVLALAIFAVVGGGLNGAIIALLATWWPYYTRVVRGEVLSIKSRMFVTAARAAGVSDTRILTRHIFRNLLEPLVVYYTLDVGTVIVTFSTIAYVGINWPSNLLEWGNMVYYYANQFLPEHPWPVIANGVMIFIAVLGFSLLGDGLRDVLDPRSRRVLSSVGEEASPVREAAPLSAAPGPAPPAIEGS